MDNPNSKFPSKALPSFHERISIYKNSYEKSQIVKCYKSFKFTVIREYKKDSYCGKSWSFKIVFL